MNTSQNMYDGMWHHLTIAYDFSLNYLYLYINGVLWTNHLTTGFNLQTTSRSKNYLGLSNYTGNSYATVLIDDFRLYDSKLSQSDICNVCGSSLYYKNTLIASLFNAYIPFTSAPNATNFMISQRNLDLR